MGDSAALVERMSTAVRTAYKAIEVLKEENKALKAENETLKLQLQALQGPQQQPGTDDEDTPRASPLSSPITLSSLSHAVRVVPTSTFKPLQQPRRLPVHAQLEPVSRTLQQPPQKEIQAKSGIVDTYIPVDSKSSLLVEEYGLSKPSCSTNFGNSPEAKKIIVFLKELSLQNVHVLAKSIAPVSMDTISKALMFTITSYITTEVLSTWENVFSSAAPLASPPQLLPQNLLAQLDLLGNLVVSLASRAFNGLIRASKLMAIVKKVILGAIRCQWTSPHYTLVMGTVRSQRVAVHHDTGSAAHSTDVLLKVKHEDGDMDNTELRSRAGSDENSEGEESEDLDSRGHDGVPGEALSSDSEAEGEDDRDDRIEPITNPIARPSLAAWGQANRSALLTSSSTSTSNGGMVGEVGAAVVPQSARKAALSSMFGLDDSSDDEGGEDGDEKEGIKEGMEEDEEEDVYMTNDNDMDLDVEDSEPVVKHDLAREAQAVLSTEVPKPTSEAGMAEQTKFSAAGGGVMDHACKVYFLLSSLVRLRLAQELVSALQEMRLVSVSNLSAGAIIGTVSVLGSARFNAFSLPGVRAELVVLLQQWCTELSAVLEEHSLSDGTNKNAQVAALSITLIAAESLRDLVGAFLAHLVPKWALLSSQPPADITSLAELFLAPFDSTDASHTHKLQSKFREQGFWGSLTQLNSLKTGLVWDKMGLDRLPGHAQKVEEMLLSWDPAHGHSTPIMLSAKDFVNSDDYLFSPLQSVVQGTLKAARIAPERLIAEELLVQEFAAHWKDNLITLSDQDRAGPAIEVFSLSRTVWCLSELLQTFFSTEYDAPEGGWRSGLSGDGFRLSSRLDNRLTVGLALLQKLVDNGSTATHFTAPSAMLMLKPSLQWMHYSSLSGRKTLEYAEFLDHCAREVFPDGAPSASAASSMSESEVIMHTAEVKLYAVCCEIAALMALASIEALVFVLVSSLRGLLTAVRTEMKLKKDKQLHSGALGLARETVRCLCKLPSPWASVSRADIQQELLESARMLNTVEESRNHKALLGADWMLRLAVCQPVFVINLDKRTDRYRRLLIMLDLASVSAVRIRAFDGTTTNQTSSLTPAEMFQRSFGSQPDASTVDSLLPAARAVACIEDAYNNIPESDVQLTWDSTLNNKFDPRCPVNVRTVATPSERACAASHLRVWRAIAAVRGTKVAKSKLRGLQSLLSASSDSPSESALASPEVVYKDLLALKTGGQLPASTAVSGSSSNSSTDKKDTPQTQLSVLEESLQPQEGLDYFIVFEDDVCFPQQSLVDLRATIHSIMRVLPPSVDILYLCGVLPKACAEFKLRNIKGDPFYSINYAWTLQAYVLRSRAVEVLLSKLPIFAPVDNFVASLVYHGELRACIVKDKLTQRLAGAILPGGGRKNDSDVRASGRSYSGLPKRSLGTPAGGKPDENGEKKRKIDRRKRRKH